MMNGWIQTYTGKKLFPLNPRPEDIDLRDIAHALSLKCRFNGHCKTFYSVADHSLRVSHNIARPLSLAALMHDAAEAYLSDISAPIKHAFHLHHAGKIETFDTAEDRLLRVIAEALHFPPIDYEQIREADLTLLVTEARDLLSDPPEPWNLPQTPLPQTIIPLTPAEAESQFLTRFQELCRHQTIAN